MKKNLFLLLLSIFFIGNTFGKATATRKKIELKVEKKLVHRSAIYEYSIKADIENSIMEINSEYPIKNINISIINKEDNEIRYSMHHANCSIINIDLTNLDINNQYLIVISVENNFVITGEFTLN